MCSPAVTSWVADAAKLREVAWVIKEGMADEGGHGKELEVAEFGGVMVGLEILWAHVSPLLCSALSLLGALILCM